MNNNKLDAGVIKETLMANGAMLKQFSVSSIALFGSYARNEANSKSDIDILVNFEKSTFRNYINLRDYLEKLFSHKVDLVCENALRDKIKPYILRDAQWVVN